MLFQDLQIIAAPPLDRKQLIEQIKDIFDVGVALVTTDFGLLLAGESLWKCSSGCNSWKNWLNESHLRAS